MACKITYYNPLTGINQPSTVGYLLTSLGIPSDSVIQYLKENYNDIPKSDSSIAEPKFRGEKAEEFLKNNGQSQNLKYVLNVQNFFEKHEITLDSVYSKQEVLNLLNVLPEDAEFGLDYKLIEDSKLGYKAYNIFPTKKLNNSFGDSSNIFSQLYKPSDNIYSVIENILRSDKLSSENKKTLEKILIPVMKYSGLELKVSDKDSNEIAEYKPSDSTITFYLKNISSEEQFIDVFIHELVHAITVNAITNPSTKEEQELADRVTEVFSSYTDANGSNPFVDKYEFIVYFVGSQEFRTNLENNSQGFFEKIINALKQFLNHVFKTNYSTNQITDLENTIDRYLESLKKNNLNLENNSSDVYNYSIPYEELQKINSRFNVKDEFQLQLKTLLDSKKINFKDIIRKANELEIRKGKFSEVEKLYSDISYDELKKSVESFYEFLYETGKYLRQIDDGLTNLKESKTLGTEDYYKKTYYAKEVGKFFIEYVNELNSIFQDGNNDKFHNTVLNAPLKNIEALSQFLIRRYENESVIAISKQLSEHFKSSVEVGKKRIDDEIKRLESVKQSAISSNNPKLLKSVEKKIEAEKEKLYELPTEENLIAAFRGKHPVEGKKPKDASWIATMVRSAALKGNLLTSSVSGFLADMFDEAGAESIELEIKAKQIGNKLDKIKTTKTALDIHNTFKTFVERKKILELKDGELEERETIVFLTEMDETAYLNDKKRLEKEITDLSNLKFNTDVERENNQRLIEIKQNELKNFIEQYEEAIFTDEFYAIQNLLSTEAKQAREEIIFEMSKIRIGPLEGDQTEEELDKLDILKTQLAQLESDYDENGILKPEEGLRIAESIRKWKADRKDNETILFELEPESEEMFTLQFDNIENKFIEAENNLKPENHPDYQFYKDQYDVVKKEYSAWLKTNTVRKIHPAWYLQRKTYIDNISKIQKKYQLNGDLNEEFSKLWTELFSILKPYKNEDGIYEGSKIREDKVLDSNGNLINLTLRVKQIEEKIDSIKNELMDFDQVTPDDKKTLTKYFNLLKTIQEKTNTPDYEKTIRFKLNEIKTKLIASGNYNNKSGIELNLLAKNELEKSQWFIDNHKEVERYDEISQTSWKTMEPLYHWKMIEPSNKNLISYNEPSFRWKTSKVNPIYKNPNRIYNSKNKRVSLKKGEPRYQNKNYSLLTTSEKEILNDMLEIHMSNDLGLPINLKRGLEIPYDESDFISNLNTESVSSFAKSIKGGISVLKDEITYNTQDELPERINENQRQLHLRYNKRINSDNIDKVSLNLLNSLVKFGTDTIRFKKSYSKLPYIYGIKETIDKNLSNSAPNSKKIINNLFDSKLHGQTRKVWSDNKIVRGSEYFISKAISLSSYAALSLRLPSTVKNFLAGMVNVINQSGIHGIKKEDIVKAQLKNSKHFYQLFKSQVEDGVEDLYIQKLRYFNIMPEDRLATNGKLLFKSNLRKNRDKVNIFKWISFLRTFGEFEMRAAAAEALSQNYLIEHKNGVYLPIMDSFKSVNGVITPMDTIEDLKGFKNVVNRFRAEVNEMNSGIHGNYGYMDKGDYSRYTLGRVAGNMKGWVTGQFDKRFGELTISSRSGLESQGFYRTFVQAVSLVMQTSSLPNTWNLLNSREKSEVIAAGKDTLSLIFLTAVVAVISQLRNVYNDDDDDDDNQLAYFLLYNILQVEDEIATLHPVAGITNIVYSRIINNPNGQDAFQYYAGKTLSLPFRGAFDIVKLTGELALSPFGYSEPFGEYIPKSRSGNILNPKRYKPDPSLKGNYDIVSKSMKLFGLHSSLNYLTGESEYLYRGYERMNERWFITSYNKEKTDLKSESISIKRQINSIKQQIDYIDDEDTKENMKSMISELKIKLDTVEKEKSILNAEYFENVIKKAPEDYGDIIN